MKKIAIIIGAIIGVTVILLILIPIIFKPQIVALVKEQANKNINATVNFKDVSVSLIKHFPNVTIAVENLSITNREPFIGDTLVSLLKFEGTANLADLIFGKKVNLVSIQLIQPKILLKSLKDGRANWQIFPQTSQAVTPQQTPSSSNMKMAIQSYKVQDGNISFKDEQSGLAVEVVNLNHQGKGDFGKDQFSLSTQTEISKLTARMSEITYLNQASLKVKADIDMDMAKNKLTFKDNEISLNRLILQFAGDVALAGDNIQINMSFLAPKADLKDILSMIPTIYQKDFDKLKAEGQLSLQGNIKGTYNKTQIPLFDINLNIENGMFQYSQVPTSVKQVAVTLQIVNPGQTLDETIIDLKRFHLEILNEPVDARLKITRPISDPTVDGYVKGRLNLGELKNVYPLGDTIKLDGLVTADFSFAGRKSSMDTKQVQQVSATGSVILENIYYSASSLSEAVQIKSANLTLSPQQASLSNFRLLFGKSDLSAQGSLENIIGYVFSGQTLKGTLTTESNNFDLNPFMAQKSTGFQAIPLPDKVEFLMTSHFSKVTLMNLDMTDVRGKLLLKDRILKMVDLNANMLQGVMIGDGAYTYVPPQKPHIDFAMKMSNFSIPGMFKTFVTVQRLTPFAEYMSGSINGSLNINSDLGDSLIPVWSSLAGQGALDISQAKIENFTPLNKVADALKLTSLKNPSLDKFSSSFSMKDGRFNLNPTPLRIGNYQVVLSGSNGIDKTLDYTMKVNIPASELKANVNPIINGLVKQDINLLTDETIVVDVGVGGTVADPKVSTSSSQIVKSTSAQLKKAAEAEAQKQKQELQQQVQNKVDQQKQDLEKSAKDQIKNKLKGLFK